MAEYLEKSEQQKSRARAANMAPAAVADAPGTAEPAISPQAVSRMHRAEDDPLALGG